MLALFIGGPLDGEAEEVDASTTVYQVLSDAQAELVGEAQSVVYASFDMGYIDGGRHQTLRIFYSPGLSSPSVCIRKMIEGYAR